MFNDNLNFRGIEEKTASMITAQKAGHVCTHKIDKSELYAEDVQLISKDDFDVSDVRDALSNFDANIEPTYKKLFENIFKTLQSGLSKLGETSTKQTKSIKALLKLIKRIPMDGKQDYDVLGFIYEYLISMFAANAGKKAGEFYTPHEVSVLMSEIVANHLKDREHIKIYDPTSGSGSLLINIGASMAQYIEGENKIDYYAQELKENTYNLTITRMNHWSSLQKPRWMRCFQTSIIVWYRVDITCCQRDHIQQHLDSM